MAQARHTRRLPHPERIALAKSRKKFLIAGVASVVAGLASVVYIQLTAEDPATAEMKMRPETLYGTPEGNKIQAAALVKTRKFATPESAPKLPPIAHNYDRERAQLMKKLAFNGKTPKFMGLDQLKFPDDGSPLNCYCLLRSPLDIGMINMWQKAGLLRHENEVPSPFLRFVTLDKPNSVDLLRNSFVESVAYSLNVE